MIGPVGIMVVALVAQVPPPDAAETASAVLRRAHQALIARETKELTALSDHLTRAGQTEAAAAVRARIEPPPPANGATRFVPRSEVVPGPAAAKGQGRGLASVPPQPKDELRAIRDESAGALFDLATRAAEQKRFALSDSCLRAVLDRRPDHREARRLLGFIPYSDGWATPHAVELLRKDNVLHPIFGWVPSSWVSHLDAGELPAPLERGQKQPRWLPAAEADALHGEWSRAWKVPTEHFLIQTNVPLSEAIAFSRQLEEFYDLFFALLGDVFGESELYPLAQRFKNKKLVGEPGTKPHEVYYYAGKQEFVDALVATHPDIAESLGVYDPPQSPKEKRKPAYFFRDQGGQLSVTATLYHEVSHQLLFESGLGAPTAYRNNEGNYWVFEGLGTYFETLESQPDGSLFIGGPVGPRMVQAALRLPRESIPLAEFVRFDQKGLHQGDPYLKYQEANALTVFFMQTRGGTYREGFLDYLKDAYKGKLKRGAGRSLDDRLNRPYRELDAELRDFLKTVPVPKSED